MSAPPRLAAASPRNGKAGPAQGGGSGGGGDIHALPGWLQRCIPSRWHRAPDRGEAATTPTDIPAAGWMDIAIRTIAQARAHDVPTLAAGVTFYAVLAFVPALSAAAAAYSLFASPFTGLQQARVLEGVAPNEAFSLIRGELQRIGERPGSELAWTLGIGLVAGLASFKAAIMALMAGLNLAYGEEECRSFLRRTAIAAGFTLWCLVQALLVLGSLLVGRNLAGAVEVPAGVILALRFSFLALVTGASLALLYRYAPCRKEPRWRWVTPGGLLAAILWLTSSSALALYVTHVARYQDHYGLLGAFMAVMVWIWLASVAALAGAELNAQLEAQTDRNTQA